MHKDFSEALVNTEIISHTQFKVCGQLYDFPSIETAIEGDIFKPEQSGLATDEALVKVLADQLYISFYVRLLPPTSTGTHSAQQNNHYERQHDFVNQLSESNQGVGTWEPGWVFRELEADGRISVLKNDVTFWLNKSDIRFEHDRIPLAGDACWVRIEKEYRRLMPAFYMAIGNGTERISVAEIQWRFYWNLRPETAARLIEFTTSLFNPLEIPFRVKVLSDPKAYHRADSGVLYIGKQDWTEVEPILGEIYAQLASGLRPEVPRYTKLLAPGLAFAQSPDNNLSFGQHRSLLVARALYFAYKDGVHEDSVRAQYLLEELHQAGLDPDRPYLMLNSEDVVAPIPCQVTVMSAQHTPVNEQANDHYSFLQASVNIGEMLCKKAYWSSNQKAANWLGHSVRPGNLNKVSPCIASLDHSLYDGLSGVALYLAQLYSLTKIDSFRRTAIGALEGACLQIRQPSSQNTPLSFYSGLLGVVYSIMEVSVLVDTSIFADRLPGFFKILSDNLLLEHCLDIISGNAGSILAFLELAQRHNIESCQEWALMLGDEIYNSAIVNNEIWTWPSQRMPGARDPLRPLTGLSHGVAGIGLALSELYRLTQRSDYGAAAAGAFAYEDSLFDRVQGNWPDLRVGMKGCSIAWCHGAPGIALARLRGAAVDPSHRQHHLDQIDIAVNATQKLLNQLRDGPCSDTSLCHGTGGLIETIATVGYYLGRDDLQIYAQEYLQQMLVQHGDPCSWPSGTLTQEANPSLMLGLAGIGHLFLRFHAPTSIRSVLLICPSHR